MGKIDLKEIKTRNNYEKHLNYEGYLWWSDQKKPVVYDNRPVTLPEEKSNHFIVEGQLFNSEENLSYSIKYVDGEYFVQEYTIATEDFEQQERKTYVSNRMGPRKLCFLRYWEERPEKDNWKERLETNNVRDRSDAEGQPVLVQTKNVFIGFKK